MKDEEDECRRHFMRRHGCHLPTDFLPGLDTLPPAPVLEVQIVFSQRKMYFRSDKTEMVAKFARHYRLLEGSLSAASKPIVQVNIRVGDVFSRSTKFAHVCTAVASEIQQTFVKCVSDFFSNLHLSVSFSYI